MTTHNFNLRAIDFDRLPPSLSKHTEPGAEAYEVVQYNAEGYEVTGERGRVLWLADVRRGGVSFGGDSVWTDAASAADAVRRVLDDEVIN